MVAAGRCVLAMSIAKRRPCLRLCSRLCRGNVEPLPAGEAAAS